MKRPGESQEALDGKNPVRGPGCQLVVAMMCDADVCGLIPTTRLKRVLNGHQTSPQGGTRFRMLRAQFWTLAQSKYISEGTQKWTLLWSLLAGLFLVPSFCQMC